MNPFSPFSPFRPCGPYRVGNTVIGCGNLLDLAHSTFGGMGTAMPIGSLAYGLHEQIGCSVMEALPACFPHIVLNHGFAIGGTRVC